MFQHIIDNVPDYAGFLTVREMDGSTKRLAEKYPEVVEMFEAGKSRNGYPIYCLKIGKGSRNALAYGCPHPNEPVGAMMLEYLSRCLAEDKTFREALDYTWYIIKCSDPDGTMMNENWFRGPFTLYHYARNYYRPAGHLQVEWTFPVNYKELVFDAPIPETRALMNIIRKVKPAFIYSLHNAGFGGVYWYMTGEMPGVYDKLTASAKKQGIPLNMGEPETPYCRELAPAIFQNLGIKQAYDYMEKYSDESPSKLISGGASCDEYAQDVCKPFTLLSEVPYFYDARIDDTSESGVLRKDCILEAMNYDDELSRIVNEHLEAIKEYISEDNLYSIALRDYTKNPEMKRETRRKMIETEPAYQRKAKVSEKFGSSYVTRFYNLLSLGLLVRVSESELEKQKGQKDMRVERTKRLKEALKDAERLLKRESDALEKELDYITIPIQKLIRVQLESGLAVATELSSRYKKPACFPGGFKNVTVNHVKAEKVNKSTI